MVKIFEVNGCLNCPYGANHGDGMIECRRVYKTHQPVVFKSPFPDWCPLPNHPREMIMALQAEVEQLREVLRMLVGPNDGVFPWLEWNDRQIGQWWSCGYCDAMLLYDGSGTHTESCPIATAKKLIGG